MKLGPMGGGSKIPQKLPSSLYPEQGPPVNGPRLTFLRQEAEVEAVSHGGPAGLAVAPDSSLVWVQRHLL